MLVGAVLALIAFGMVMVFSSGAVFAAQEVRRRRPTSSSASSSTRVLGPGRDVARRRALDYCDLPAARLPAARRRRILTLAAVLKIGSRAGGAIRWFRLGPLSFQPSELAKLALCVYLAYAAGPQGREGAGLLRRLPAAAAGDRPDDGAPAQAARPRHRGDLRRASRWACCSSPARAPSYLILAVLVAAPAGLEVHRLDAVPHAAHAGLPRPVGLPARRRLPDHRVADQRRLGRRHRPRPGRRAAEAVLPARGAHRLHPVHRRRGAGAPRHPAS